MNRHGLNNHPLYRVWNGMKQRCNNPHDDFFYCYGARGIRVCNDWSDNFKNFYEWAMENGYRPGLTIDRRNADGNYCPENCRWITMREQQANKRNSVFVEDGTERITLAEVAKRYGISKSTALLRFRQGATVCAPLTIRNFPVERNDGAIFSSMSEAARRSGTTSSKVSAVCSGKRRHANGFGFRRITREDAEKALQEMEGKT